MPPPVRRINVGTAVRRGAAAAPKPAPNQVRVESGRATTTRTVSDRQGPYHESSGEEVVSTRRFAPAEQVASVKVGAGLTLNLGNFESLRIDCHVTLPCSVDDLDATYEVASDFVSRKIEEEQTSWLGKGNAKGKK